MPRVFRGITNSNDNIDKTYILFFYFFEKKIKWRDRVPKKLRKNN